jgi:hypothetical protein
MAEVEGTWYINAYRDESYTKSRVLVRAAALILDAARTEQHGQAKLNVVAGVATV